MKKNTFIEENKKLNHHILRYIGYTMWLLSLLILIIILLLLCLMRFELYIECGDLIDIGEPLKILSTKLRDNILFSALNGDDFGVGSSDTISDAGRKLSTDPLDWGFTFDYKFSNYHSSSRSSDARMFANICDYLFKVHDVNFINKETIAGVFPNNDSAKSWFSDYDNSWGRKHNDTYRNTSEFRDHLRKIKYYKNY